MEFDLSIFLGAVTIAVALYFGLWGVRKDVGDKLSDIRDRIITMGVILDKVWDLIKVHFGESGGTVERRLTNLGKAKISAQPGENETTYVVDIEKPVLQDNLITKLSKTTDLEEVEKKFFGNKRARVTTSTSTHMLVTIPCTDPKKCAEYMSLFLKWLDSVYFELLSTIMDYEQPIKV